MTRICPSHAFEDPIPIVGILIDFVIFLAEFFDIHSKTIEKAPAFSIFCACFNNFIEWKTLESDPNSIHFGGKRKSKKYNFTLRAWSILRLHDEGYTRFIKL